MTMWLTLLILLPSVGALLLLGFPEKEARAGKTLAFGFSAFSLGLALYLWKLFDPLVSDLQFVERHAWIPSLRVEYFLGLDGVGLVLLLLTALVVPAAILATPSTIVKPQIYYALILLLQSGLFGTFTALNFVLWFLFWEITLIPAFFLVRFWGGGDRARASVQFFIYTLVGSVALLLSFLALYIAVGTFDFLELAEMGQSGQIVSAMVVRLGWYSLDAEQLAGVIFFMAFLGFAVKTPLVPFHNWLPLTYSEAPATTTMLVTGLMSKMGVYGFIRILLPIFPEQTRSMLTVLFALTVITILYSAFAALAQTDLKRILAYSSINHLGYCLLAVFALADQSSGPNAAFERTTALNGLILQIFNHGITASALFCFVAYLERRAGSPIRVTQFSGLRKTVPVLCGLMGLTLFASVGLPGLGGFISEFLIFKGAFALSGWPAALATLGLLITAIFFLSLMQKLFHGPVHPQWRNMSDLTLFERATILPAIVLMVVLGVYPQVLLQITNGFAQQFAMR